MSPSPEFSSEIVAVLSATAGGKRSKTYRNVEKSRCNKKRALLFGRMRAKSLVDIFRKMG